MVNPADDIARAAAATLITEKRDALVSERTVLLEQRSEILTRLRRIDRELADCRAGARLFGLKIEFPPDEREEAERAAALRHRHLMLEMEQDRERARARNMVMHGSVIEHGALARMALTPAPPPAPPQPSTAPMPATPPLPNETPPAAAVAAPSISPRVPLREILLEQLKLAESKGSKAAPLRDYFERTYGTIIHEKTVGMTLYRLLKEGLVRREGHTWFFGAAQAETENPGAVTPGSNNADS